MGNAKLLFYLASDVAALAVLLISSSKVERPRPRHCEKVCKTYK